MTFFLFFYAYTDHRDLHSFPTRRSSDLVLSDPVVFDMPAPFPKKELPAPVVLATPACSPKKELAPPVVFALPALRDRKSTRLNSSHVSISYAVFCLKKKNNI